MPLPDAQIEDTISSNVSDQDDQQQAQADNQASTAAEAANSSNATGDNDTDDLLSVVRDVVGKNKPAEPVAASPADGEDEGSDDEEGDKKADDENYSDVPFHKHPRFQKLLRDKKAAEVDAGRYRNVQDFIDARGLSSEEAADGLEIMGLAKTNPAEAWKRLKPFVEKVLIAAGEVLPDDLNQRIHNGELSREGALEIARARAQAQSIQASTQFQQQREEQRRQSELTNSLTSTAAEWERTRTARDPNFAAKQEPLLKELTWLQAREGKPTTPEGVKDQLNRAYKAVNASLPAAIAAPARPRPVRPVTGGQVAGNQQPSANSTLDIIKARVGQRA